MLCNAAIEVLQDVGGSNWALEKAAGRYDAGYRRDSRGCASQESCVEG